MSSATITVEELMKLILFLVAVGIGCYLIIAIRNIVGILKRVRVLVDENANYIDSVLKDTPEIIENISKITLDLKDNVEIISPTIPKIVENISSISEDVSESVEKVNYTVEVVGDSIEETASSLRESRSNITTYLNIILEITDILRGVFNKK
ncbi:hypothetical protein [Gottschalkia acidurici]|uniref:hypothetical protein n=1 Tax=Clostridium acidurici TaxID=1556 RepID=UPI0002F49AB5|nr:hypothetical protein [Gottschalkia acidurici]